MLRRPTLTKVPNVRYIFDFRYIVDIGRSLIGEQFLQSPTEKVRMPTEYLLFPMPILRNLKRFNVIWELSPL